MIDSIDIDDFLINNNDLMKPVKLSSSTVYANYSHPIYIMDKRRLITHSLLKILLKSGGKNTAPIFLLILMTGRLPLK